MPNPDTWSQAYATDKDTKIIMSLLCDPTHSTWTKTEMNNIDCHLPQLYPLQFYRYH